MKEKIKRWWSIYKEDLIFNIIMTITSTLLFIIMIILFIKCIGLVIDWRP